MELVAMWRTCAVAVVVAATALGLTGCPAQQKRGAASDTPSVAESIRVASSDVVVEDGEPKVVLAIYEDFLCPACRQFESTFGPSVAKLIDDGTVAVDYYMVAILDQPRTQNYSSRAGGAAYCVADADTTPDKQAFRRFHAALFARQPSETGSAYPTDDELIETARQAGLTGSVAQCVEDGKYAEISAGLARATDVTATPTVRLNGEDYEVTTPEDLVAKAEALAR